VCEPGISILQQLRLRAPHVVPVSPASATIGFASCGPEHGIIYSEVLMRTVRVGSSLGNCRVGRGGDPAAIIATTFPSRAGVDIELAKFAIATRRASPTSDFPAEQCVTDARPFIDDPTLDIVIELDRRGTRRPRARSCSRRSAPARVW